MISAPAISIILPVRNAAATLPRALASLQAQTFPDWELIAVDDGSTDETAEILGASARSDPRVRVLHQTPAGIVAALNRGLAEARAPLIARMDADDECLPERFARQVELLAREPALGVCATQVRYGGDAQVNRGYALHVEWTNTLVTPEQIAQNRFVESPVAHPSVLFRRELVQQHGGYREAPAWPEDYELWLRWMDAGVRFAKVPEPLLVWNDPPGRLSRTDSRYSVEAFYACKCHYLAKWLKREVAADRPVFLRGAGRPTRQRFASLAAEGVQLAGYVDVDPKKIGGRVGGLPVLAPAAVPPAAGCFVIVGVGTRGAREIVRAELLAQGRLEGRDFLVAA